MAEPMLSVYNINVWYGAIHAIKDISFNVNEGEIVALIGANGAGKSTTLKTVSGLLRSKTGSIKFMGEDITHAPADKLVGKGLAQVPEGRRAFLQMTVEENLEMGAYTQAKSTVAPGLERVYEQFPRLKERRRQVAGTLSGGEQQMLVMGRALMSNPKLLMLDEPSMGADLPDCRGPAQGRYHGASGRAKRTDGAFHRHTRLRARDRQDNHDRQRPRAAPRRQRPQSLPGRLRGSAVLPNGGPVDAARAPERQVVIQRGQHDQKVYAALFSCQFVRSGARSLTYAQPAALPWRWSLGIDLVSLGTYSLGTDLNDYLQNESG